MSKHIIRHPDDIDHLFSVSESRLMLDSKIAGEPCINVNHVTVLAGTCNAKLAEDGTPYGPKHEKAEIYVVISGQADVYVEDEKIPMRQGSLLYIRGGQAHYVDNTESDVPFCFLTLWPNEADNDVWHLRKRRWGENYNLQDPKHTP